LYRGWKHTATKPTASTRRASWSASGPCPRAVFGTLPSREAASTTVTTWAASCRLGSPPASPRSAYASDPAAASGAACRIRAAAGEFADGDEHGEGEEGVAVLGPVPEDGAEAARGDETGAQMHEGGQTGTPADGGAAGRGGPRRHRVAPDRPVTGSAGAGTAGVRGSSAVTAGCQPSRPITRTRAVTMRGSKWSPAHRWSSRSATGTGRARL